MPAPRTRQRTIRSDACVLGKDEAESGWGECWRLLSEHTRTSVWEELRWANTSEKGPHREGQASTKGLGGEWMCPRQGLRAREAGHCLWRAQGWERFRVLFLVWNPLAVFEQGASRSRGHHQECCWLPEQTTVSRFKQSGEGGGRNSGQE